MRERSKNKIPKILSTMGGEFLVVESEKEYVGLYYYHQGFPYKGVKDPKSEDILASIQFGIESIEFAKINPGFGQHLKDPRAFSPVPQDSDYKRSSITRYFVKNFHTAKIIEVSKNTYKYYKKHDMKLKGLYATLKILWKISGPLNDIKDSDGTIIKTGIVETNLKTMGIHSKLFAELPTVIPPDDLAKITQ